jgi:cytochrome c553
MTRSAICGAAGTTFVLVLTWTGGVSAADVSGVVSARPRIVNAVACEACHGARGEGAPAAAIPRLAGQYAEYLEKQLRDYADGTRKNPVMQNFAIGLSESERTNLSVYYASLTAPQLAQSKPGNAQQLSRGHQLAVQGAEAERVQACISCHGPDGSGVAHAAPYLAGQSAEYLSSALKAWQQGTRRNDGGQLMASVAGQLSPADITAVSAYFSSLGTAGN